MDTTPCRLHRPWPIATAALVCAALLNAPARALDAPTGAVILSVSGALTRSNDNGAASFDMALLATLPQHSFSTKTPWFPQPRKFTGVLVRDLLDAVGSRAGIARAIALNDYRADLPTDELVRNGAMIAYLLDDQPMPVREKGPLVIIFPFSDRPELRTAVHYSRAVWQLRSLELR
jgi:hypothetical protein